MRLFIFRNVHFLIKAERLFREAGMKAELIPIPKTLSSDCGLCLLVEEDLVREAEKVLEKAGVEMVGVYEYG